MERRYKIILSNPNLYKEIELGSQARTLRVGTGIECDVRLHGELFFSPVQLSFSRDSEDVWSVLCTDDLYLGSDSEFDVSKPIRRQLTHGDILHVKYRQSDTLVFTVEFMIDFDSGKLRYERFIDIGSEDEIIIGTDPGSQIVLTGEYAEKERVVLYRTAGGLRLEVRETTYGVYHNGRKVEQSVALNNMDYFSVSDYFFYYRDKVLYAEIRPDMTVNRLSKKDRPSNPAYPRFNRSTRIQEKVDEEAIEILDPPPKPQKPKNNLVTRLLPAMGMLIAAGVMAYFGGMMIIMSAISGTMAVITTLITYRESKKDYQEGTVSRIEKYTAYIEKKREEIQQAREEEKEQLDRIYLSGEEEQRLFDDFSPALFDRSPEDPDFLCVRLGTGDVEARRALEYKKQERLEVEDDLQLMPEQLCEEFRYIEDAPVVCDLKEANAVGVVGSEECRFALLKNIMVDLTARQYCSDVQFAFISSEENAEKIRWLRFLPQVIDPVTDLRMIVTDEESRVTVFECLYRELSAREQKKTIESRLVVFFYDECGFKSHPISKFIENASKLGVCFVFFGRTEADIPLGCDAIVRSDALGQGSLIDAHGEKRTLDFSYSELSTNAAKRVVRLLAPVYTEEISLESSLTRSISMFQMLNIFSASDLDLGSRWASTKVFQSMAAPVGVSKTGIVQLDLHDKAHGPHGLVAGTTGSGKSELLQTYILSMATLFSPTEVGFVIIDFKGGGMANQFRELPHLMGTITNIDGKEIERSLKSIKAELQTRQRLFAEADVNHIDKYIRKYRAGEVVRPLPHLIVVVDEFAELKAEQPEFMKELISAARIGRSLGVHLILATQKPSGQVSEQIWSNSRFKLCLKVQTQEDSNEVLKSPLAAEIKEPGRAYLQVGNNEIFELFQSAYSGASEKVYDDSVRDFSLCSVSDVGKRTVIFKQKSKKPGEDTRSQLDAIVSYVAEYCRTAGVQELPNIFMPPLQSVIDFPADAGVKAAPPVTTVDLGIFDDPENQLQDVYSLDIENQNLMIIGSAQSGKTNLLQTIIRSVAARYTPEEVTLYIIDFASMTLKNFESLKHVGGVVTAAEDEKLRNLFKLLLGEIEVRKNRMLAVGVSSFSAYREAGFTDMPNILVLIDNLTALKETYFQDDTEILRLCREGLSVGISVIVANGQTAGIGYKYLSNFSARIALFCNDPSEYNALFNHCRERVGDVHGRCLIEQDKRFLDCQIYLAFQGEKEIERVEKIRAFVKETNARVTGRARMIPMIPDLLTQSFMSEQFADRMRSQYSVVVGLDYSTVSPVSIPFATQGILAVSGRAHSGKSNFIRYIVKMLEEMYPGRSAVYIVDSVARRLSDLKAAPNVREYGILAGRAAELVCAVAEQLKSRYDALAAGNEEELEKSELLVLIFNTPDAAEAVSADPKALEAFRNILGRYKNLNSFILLGNYENTNVSYNAPEVIKKARDLRQIVFFDDISSMKIVDIPILVQREFRKPIAIGDGYFIHENECVKIKTARVSDQA